MSSIQEKIQVLNHYKTKTQFSGLTGCFWTYSVLKFITYSSCYVIWLINLKCIANMNINIPTTTRWIIYLYYVRVIKVLYRGMYVSCITKPEQVSSRILFLYNYVKKITIPDYPIADIDINRKYKVCSSTVY